MPDDKKHTEYGRAAMAATKINVACLYATAATCHADANDLQRLFNKYGTITAVADRMRWDGDRVARLAKEQE